ncbi:MAG: HD domain-containing protein [Mycoplasmatales bacterium]
MQLSIRDVIHGDIHISDELIIKLIRTREFQRLRKIKQLGLSYYVFHGAEHSRFSHSIGVYHLATLFLDELESKSGLKYDELERRSFLVACILHDIGHGPFSHASEEYFSLNHETYTIQIIEDERTQINQLLQEAGLIDQVIAFINKTHSNKELITLLSSSIDVDRMDYLNRDSYYCGVSYGIFDMSRILKIISKVDGKIVFEETGIHTVEDFLMSRYHMFVQVYLNDKSLGYETLLGTIIKRIHTLLKEDFKFVTDIELLKTMFNKDIDTLDYLLMDDYYIINKLNDLLKEDDQELIQLIEGLLTFKELEINTDSPSGIKWLTEEYRKKVYNTNEPILILKEDGTVTSIENCSTIIKFFEANIDITINKYVFSFKDNEN